MSTATVGKPMTGVEVKLIDWAEGGYKVTDQPHPRGKGYVCMAKTSQPDLFFVP